MQGTANHRISFQTNTLLMRVAMMLLCAWAMMGQPLDAASYTRSKLHGFSMFPTIKSGESILYKKVPIEVIREGDIIVFRDQVTGGQVCHRVDAIDPTGTIKTKGDNNRFRDRGLITSENLIGLVTHINGESV
jgi:signal peptidase I